MTKIILPAQLLADEISEAQVLNYHNRTELEQAVNGATEPFTLVLYEQDFAPNKDIARLAEYLIIITYQREFLQFSHNVFFIHGEKINAYTLFLMLKMIAINRQIKQETLENYAIGIDITSELDERTLWDKILTFCRRSTGAEAGTLYVMSKDKKAIYFVCSQNDKLDRREIEKREIPFNTSSLVGYVCSTGDMLNIGDAYELGEDKPYRFNRQIDIQLGYRTCSIITVPMTTPHGEIIGAVQLINKKHKEEGSYVAFSAYDEMLLRSLSSLAAVSLENRRLYGEISNLLDSLIVSSTKAIEQRDPATKGHSLRVSRLTRRVMELMNAQEKRFGEEDMRSAEIAALLHDFGKVGVRENILTKVNKLYPADYERIKWRLRYTVARLIETKASMEAHAENIAFIKHFLTRLDQINSPAPLNAEDKKVLDEAVTKSFLLDGEQVFVLTEEEHRFLAIDRGNLTDSERTSMEYHVLYSFELMKAMKWPYELSKVPDYVVGHHEKLDGSGYPYHKKGEEIGMVERILAIADIFDALTASDRPYKKAIPRDKALSIIEDDVKKGKLDSSVFILLKDNIAEIETFVAGYPKE